MPDNLDHFGPLLKFPKKIKTSFFRLETRLNKKIANSNEWIVRKIQKQFLTKIGKIRKMGKWDLKKKLGTFFALTSLKFQK